MRSTRLARCALACSAAGAALVLAVWAPAAAGARPGASTPAAQTSPGADGGSPEDFGTPTGEQLAKSVRVWDLSRSVRVWDTSKSVRPLVQETTENDQTVITLASDILFTFGSADIPANATAVIGEALQGAPPSAAVSVSGHTDSVGDTAANQVLSEQRAAAVAAAIRSSRPDLVLQVSGEGESQPVAPNESGGNDDPEGRALNRRVEIRFST